MIRRMVAPIALLVLVARSAHADEGLRTFDGQHSIANIEVTLVYFVPKDRAPIADWQDRVRYFARRIEAFHRREFEGQSTLKTIVVDRPFRSSKTAEEIRGKDANETYYHTVEEARDGLPWSSRPRGAFPILLVLSEINWRELDDFRRVRVVNGKEVHEGNINAEGRHFPGAESGGSRAAYWADGGYGLGLVSADGWRVPCSGSDCVVYHEGVGHTIGLPHPEPGDDSVMGTAQYQGWINETFLNVGQKQALGWKPRAEENPPRPSLFTAFTALPSPHVPAVGKPVPLLLRWPKNATVKSLRCRYQTELSGPWSEVKQELGPDGTPPGRMILPPFQHATPVSYRIDATLTDGQEVEIWGYFQVK